MIGWRRESSVFRYLTDPSAEFPYVYQKALSLVLAKMSVVSRLLRGEPLDLVARDTNVSVAKLTEWRVEGAASALKERERDDRDDEIARLKSKVGEITMDELLYAKIAAMEGKRPLARGRPRR
jgi:hypothetical protein